uniref:Uncharacterized protein n=1 Tax=Eptatretus burgeri TaxID=7764 RepID=A0A8C4Q1G3_EPTBU
LPRRRHSFGGRGGRGPPAFPQCGGFLGKMRAIFPGEKFPGSTSYLVSLKCLSLVIWLVFQGRSKEAYKKLCFVPGLVFIDEGAACRLSAGERQRACAQMTDMFEATGFPYHIVTLEQVSLRKYHSLWKIAGSVAKRTAEEAIQVAEMCESITPAERVQNENLPLVGVNERNLNENQVGMRELEDNLQPNNVLNPLGEVSAQSESSFQALMDSVKTLTAKEDLLYSLRHRLLVHVARRAGYTKVLLGESCSRIAIRLLSNVLLGRGATLARDTGFCDDRYGDVSLLRPMREHMAKEIAYYNHVFKVSTVTMPSLDTKNQCLGLPEMSPPSQVQKTQSPGAVGCVWVGWVQRASGWGHKIWSKHN